MNTHPEYYEFKVTATTPAQLREKTLALVDFFNSTIPDLETVKTETAKAEVKKPRKSKASANSGKWTEGEPLGTHLKFEVPVNTKTAIPVSDPFDDMFGAETPESPTAAKVTHDDLREALKKYHEEFGQDMTRLLLKKFGASRPADVNERDYAAVVKECAKS